jgi:nitroreductase
VPEDVLRTLMETVRCAPSWFNTQCREVVVVKNVDIKSQLAKTVPKDNIALFSLIEAPIVLVFCSIKGISGYDQGKAATVKGDWLMFDTGLAVQNLCLAAHGLGLGTVVIGLFDHRKVAEILGVPENIDVVAMVPLGYPAAKGDITKRKNSSEFIHHNKYPQ